MYYLTMYYFTIYSLHRKNKRIPTHLSVGIPESIYVVNRCKGRNYFPHDQIFSKKL